MSSDAPSFDKLPHLATLARLELSPENIELFTVQCTNILQYMACLQAVDTSSIDPMYTPLENHKAMRPDSVLQTASQQDVLANAPKNKGSNEEYFIVPRIV